MYLTADDLPASTELYGHMFDVHFLGPGIWEMAKCVPFIEEIISFFTDRYSGYLLLISNVSVVVIPYAKAFYLLDSLSRN